MMFRSCKSLTEVNIPNSVTTIEFQAFEYCSTLQSIHLPNSITKINYRLKLELYLKDRRMVGMGTITLI